jgi:hypothetical protein
MLLLYSALGAVKAWSVNSGLQQQRLSIARVLPRPAGYGS